MIEFIFYYLVLSFGVTSGTALYVRLTQPKNFVFSWRAAGAVFALWAALPVYLGLDWLFNKAEELV